MKNCSARRKRAGDAFGERTAGVEVDKGTAGVTLEAACVGVEGKEMEGEVVGTLEKREEVDKGAGADLEAVSACVEKREAGRRSSGAKNR